MHIARVSPSVQRKCTRDSWARGLLFSPELRNRLEDSSMFGMDSSKLQEKGKIPGPEEARGKYGELIVSPDTLRTERLPSRQSRTLKWPVLDASGAPEIDLARWRFSLEGLVQRAVSWSWEEFNALPK